MYRRLRRRLTAVCAVSTGLVLVGMAAASFHYSLNQLERQSDEAYESSLNTVFFYLRGQTVIDHTWLARTETAEGLYIRVDQNGKALLFNAQNPRRMAATTQAGETALADYGFDIGRAPAGTLQPDTVRFRLQHGGAEYRACVATVPSGENWFGAVILKDTAPERAQARRLAAIFTVCVLVSLVCLCGVAWFFTAWAVRPVRENHRRQTEFVSAASHELRSPLAVMRASAGAIPGAEPQRAAHFAGLVEQECDRLSRLTDDLLKLAGADSGRLSIAPARLEPETVLLTACERFEALAAAGGIALRADLPPDPLPPISGDEQRLLQALAVLLDNAIRHTPENGRILCAARRRRRQVIFSVADSGPGIPDSEKGRVFQRFYRGDASRTAKEHYGLGLSIAREIALLHRGTLSVADSPLGGAQFNLGIPVQSRLQRQEAGR